ncbi:hypothetical protein MHB40_20475 [Lysinibacillus sp. FSL K6-0057]|uniref:hypothetical protein n=1 Tax=Lysinibacillus sp. FSL K6-0057 TaxID=2921411 RepID=UPI00315AF080
MNNNVAFLKAKKVDYINVNGDYDSVIVKRVSVFTILNQISELVRDPEIGEEVISKLTAGELDTESAIDALVYVIPKVPSLLNPYLTEEFDYENVADFDGLKDILLAIYGVNMSPNLAQIKKFMGGFKKKEKDKTKDSI